MSASASQDTALEPAAAPWPADVLAAANINPQTLLATDYLNVFNEALMLIQLAPDAPDMLDELADWRLIDYAGHFARSGFVQRDLVIAAYRAAPAPSRAAFDDAAQELGGVVGVAVAELLARRADPEALAQTAPMWAEAIEAGVAHLDALIHGRTQGVSAQDDIDALFAD